MEYSLPDSSVHGILQARILEWVAIPFSSRSSWPRDQTWVSCTAGRLCHLSHQGSPENSLVPSNMWRHKVWGDNLWTRKQALMRYWICQHLGLRFLNHQSTSLWYFFIVSQLIKTGGKLSLHISTHKTGDPNKADPSQLPATNNVLHSWAVCVCVSRSVTSGSLQPHGL